MRFLIAFAALLTVASATVLNAGKGNGKGGGGGDDGGGDTGPQPTGGIYFYDDSGWPSVTIQSMDATDGGNKTAELLPITRGAEDYQRDPEPSRGTYGGQAIWLTQHEDDVTGNPELFALRQAADGSLQWLQVTNFNWDIIPGQLDRFGPRWGNSITSEGETLTDDFISVAGMSTLSDGTHWQTIYRIQISGAEIAAAMDAGGVGWTPLTSQDAIPLVGHEWFVDQQGPNFQGHDWSPDGTELVYGIVEQTDTDWVGTLVLYDLALDWSWDIFGGQPEDTVIGPRWSPDGSQIAVKAGFKVSTPRGREHWEGIVAVTPDGLSSIDVDVYESYGSNYFVGIPFWSPDSKFLSYYQGDDVKVKGENFVYWNIVRVLGDGSGKTILTNDLDPLFKKTVLGWR